MPRPDLSKQARALGSMPFDPFQESPLHVVAHSPILLRDPDATKIRDKTWDGRDGPTVALEPPEQCR